MEGNRKTLPKLQIDPCFGLSLSLYYYYYHYFYLYFFNKTNILRNKNNAKKGLGGGFSEIQERASSKHREVLLCLGGGEGGGEGRNADAFAVNPYLCS
jgi:hypothetical protein